MVYPYDYVCTISSEPPSNCTNKSQLDCSCRNNSTTTNTPTPTITPTSVIPSTLPPEIVDTTPPTSTGFVIEVPTSGYNLTNPVTRINDNLDLVLSIGIPMVILGLSMMAVILYKALATVA
eukprot:TRINITY_DN864_c0_g1_i7.p2 TRINITY_DN864_c0_g1~~TRINITY_DN864_c0_g1_i7.p2  ORF type:complete len:121 (-),score=18.29 TRINITY_DN864_c0_g1_i7:72-434(-)